MICVSLLVSLRIEGKRNKPICIRNDSVRRIIIIDIMAIQTPELEPYKMQCSVITKTLVKDST